MHAIHYNLRMKLCFTSSKNESYKLCFEEDPLIAQKTRLFITFKLLIQMKLIKASNVDKNMIYKKIGNFILNFCRFLFLPVE